MVHLQVIDTITTITDIITIIIILGCTSLSKVTFPSTMIKYGDNIFSGCLNLQEVTITTHAVSSSGPVSFQGLTSLQRVTLIQTSSDSMGNIGDYRFQDCTSLNTVNIPDTISMIGDYTFAGRYYCYYYY